MDSPLFSEQAPLTIGLEDSSLVPLLERGLQCARQERYAEGATFFVLARERLSPNQVHIYASLNALIEISTGYWQAQQALHEASKRFAEADSAQQAQLATLEKLLPTLMENISTIDQPFTNSKGHQQLQTLRTPIANSTGRQSPAEAQLLPEVGSALPGLYFTCFGRFEVRRLGQPIVLCSSRSGQSILRYLAAQPGHSATFDTLMALLWPDDEPEVAQPKLHSAISALRHSLNQGFKCNLGSGYIVCKNRIYSFNPAVVIRTDVDEFLQYYEVERHIGAERVAFYEKACSLYTGPLLPEDLYADWSFLQREHLNRVYLSMCRALNDHYLKTKSFEEAAKWAIAILKVNRCDEEAHRLLIQIYGSQGRRIEALLQYQRCENLLREELGVAPLPETTRIFQKLLTSEPFSTDAVKIQ